jgi:hypothetical protein
LGRITAKFLLFLGGVEHVHGPGGVLTQLWNVSAVQGHSQMHPSEKYPKSFSFLSKSVDELRKTAKVVALPA